MASDKQRFVVEGASHDHVLQRHPIQKFHGDEALAVVFANFVDGADIRVVQRGCGTRLTPEALQRLCVFGHIFGKKFQRDEAAERGVLGFIDDTHPATT